MTDKIDNLASDEVAGSWLSPSEALTRFVAGQQAHAQTNSDVAPIRFGFRVGNFGLLVPTGMLSELIEDTEVYPLPTTASWFCGLINLRGDLVPVFDLIMLFSIEDKDKGKPNLLVLNTGAGAVSVLIDGLPLTVDIRQRLEQLPPLPEILLEHSNAVYVREQEVWVDFNFEGLFRAASNWVVT